MAELTPSFTVSSTFSSGSVSYTGASAKGGAGLRDGSYVGGTSVWASDDGVAHNNWIRADLASEKLIEKIGVAPISYAFDSWGADYLDGAMIQTSANGSSWTSVESISGTSEGMLTFVSLGVSSRYWRIYTDNDYLGLSEFRIYEINPVVNGNVAITTTASISNGESKVGLVGALEVALVAVATAASIVQIGATAAPTASAATVLSGGALRISGAVAPPVQAAAVLAVIEVGTISGSAGFVTGQASAIAVAILPVHAVTGIATAAASAVSAATQPLRAQASMATDAAFMAGNAILQTRAAAAVALDAAGFTAEASLSRIAMLPEARLITFTQDRATDRRITLNQARSADRILQL